MHLLERSPALAELNELFRQWSRGELSTDEYRIAFRQVDEAHSHDLRCANGDGRIATLNIGGRLLCSVCGWKHHEARA
jgi:hypothetical protein